MKPALSYFITVPDNPETFERKPLSFPSPPDLLEYVTERWEDNFVTDDLKTKELVEYFLKRPFFMLVSVDTPLMQRYYRSIR
jgi:dCMP deaminase